MSEQSSNTTRCKLGYEKLGTSHDVKSFAIGLSALLLKYQIIIDQAWVKFAQKIPTKLAVFFRHCFSGKLAPRIVLKSLVFIEYTSRT